MQRREPYMPYEQQPPWSPDVALPGFEAATLRFPDDYDGPVRATLVRRRAAAPTRKAFLYVHGFVDYFYQTHLADECNDHGFNFYALDLRKYGRSLGDAPHPNFCKDVREYFSEISAALLIITEEEGNDWIVLGAHSTGGLISALYAHAGAQKDRINALYLNSPFFDFNLDPVRKAAVVAASRLGTVLPFAPLKGGVSTACAESIHADHYGEWRFDPRWKPIEGFPAYLGWIRAILRAQQRVRDGLAISCPVLVMHSDKSVYGKQWHPGFQAGDGVLNVEHIREGSRHLGANVKVVEIRDGLHDLVLSRLYVRERVFKELFDWLAGLEPAPAK